MISETVRYPAAFLMLPGTFFMPETALYPDFHPSGDLRFCEKTPNLRKNTENARKCQGTVRKT
jgi:hypothetical protein